MKRLLLPLLSIALLAGFTPVAPERSRVERGPVELTLVDRDRDDALPRYRHDGQYWVAGERGHRYAVRLHNASPERVLVVLSVDGINAVSGESATPDQTGYVLAPWQSTDITGWRKSNDEVAQFVFSSPRDSYAQRTGRGEDLGVVGIAVFGEKRAVRWLPGPPTPRGRIAKPASRAEAAADSSTRSMAEMSSAPAPAQRLGTAHGDREFSSVRDTSFERATAQPVQISQLRYDSARNLRARGIVLEDRASNGDRIPQAFPQRFVADPPRR